MNRALIDSAFAAGKALALSRTAGVIAGQRIVATTPESWAAPHWVLLGTLIGMAIGGLAGGAARFCPGYAYSEGVSGNCRVEPHPAEQSGWIAGRGWNG